MKEGLLEFLTCPACHSDLHLHATERENSEVIGGRLSCSSCQETFPIQGGVPRFVATSSVEQESTAKNFGAQWLTFDHVTQEHEAQFLDWIAPVKPDFVRGKVVLEAGCGKARHTRLIAEWGARAVIGVDLSNAVDAAFRNTRDCANVHIIQANIYQLPLKPVFDYAFSVGVLHHLPNPRSGFLSVAGRLRPGGSISAWVYGRENNGWLLHLVNPVRKNLTSRLPFRVLYYLSFLLTGALYPVLRLVYRPLQGTAVGRHLFYSDYLTYIAHFHFREIHNIVHDHLTAPIAHYIAREELDDWFREAGADQVEISWHNRNSWRGIGRVAGHVEGTHAQ